MLGRDAGAGIRHFDHGRVPFPGDGDTDPDEMVDAICELSGLPREVVVEDVRRILLQFEEADILTWKA